MTHAGRRDALALLAAGVLATAALLATAEPMAWVGALVAVLGLWAVWRLPLRTTLLGIMLFALAVDNPHEKPAAGYWENPLRPLARLFFVNLHHSIPVPFLRVSGLEVLLAVLLVVVLVRRAREETIDPPRVQSPTPLRQALLLSVVTLIGLEAWGLLRGGDFKASVFQLRVMLALPLVTYLFLHGLRGAADVRALARVVFIAAAVKVALSVYFVLVLCRAQGLSPPYATQHSDTVLYVVTLMIVVARWWERPSPRAFLEGAVVGAVVMVGLVLNDRRLAYVSLAGAVVAMVLLSPWNRAKRALARLVLASVPILLLYVAVGWSSRAEIFKPVRDLRSMVASSRGVAEDASTRFRDNENLNLAATWRRTPVFGAGFGHEFEEVIPLPDITAFMAEYHYQPHNGVLWLWTIGGLVGFTLMWLFLVVGVYCAARAYHHAVAPHTRAAMLVCLGVFIAFVNQVYGDMGTQSYTCVFLVAPALALAGQVAVAVGGWSAPAGREPLFGVGREAA